jgi:hypothetical protein
MLPQSDPRPKGATGAFPGPGAGAFCVGSVRRFDEVFVAGPAWVAAAAACCWSGLRSARRVGRRTHAVRRGLKRRLTERGRLFGWLAEEIRSELKACELVACGLTRTGCCDVVGGEAVAFAPCARPRRRAPDTDPPLRHQPFIFRHHARQLRPALAGPSCTCCLAGSVEFETDWLPAVESAG